MSSALYRNYLLGVLLVILAFNYVDRLALGLLLQDIKADLSLSDTQLGLLSGIAFAFFYSAEFGAVGERFFHGKVEQMLQAAK